MLLMLRVDHKLQKDSAKAEVKTRLNNWYFEVTHDETSRLGRDNHHLRELCEATLVYSFTVGERLVEALDTTRGSMELIEKWCKLFDSNWVVALSLITLWTGNHVFTKLFQDLVKSWGPCQASLQHQGTMADQLSIIRSVTLETPLSVDGTWEVGLAKSKEFIENRLAANSGNKRSTKSKGITSSMRTCGKGVAAAYDAVSSGMRRKMDGSSAST